MQDIHRPDCTAAHHYFIVDTQPAHNLPADSYHSAGNSYSVDTAVLPSFFLLIQPKIYHFNISPSAITNATANEPIFSTDLQIISRQYLLYLFLHNSLLNIVNRTIVGYVSCVIEINLAVIHVVPFAVVFAEGL